MRIKEDASLHLRLNMGKEGQELQFTVAKGKPDPQQARMRLRMQRLCGYKSGH